MRLVPFLFGVARRAELPGTVLVRLLGDLGVTPSAGRALIARMRAEGNLAGVRQGRQVGYRLAGDLAQGFARVRSGPGAPAPWPGYFHALLYHVPEDRRAFRDRLRRAARLRGFGILAPGILISLSDRFEDLAPVLAQAPPTAQVFPAHLRMADGDAARAAATAWDLPALDRLYRDHIRDLAAAAADPRVPTGAAALRRFTDLVSIPLRDLLREPALPDPLRPADWPVPELRATVLRAQGVYFPPVADYVGGLLPPEPEAAG